MLLPNMAPWCVDYFRLKEFENWQMEEGLSDLPLSSLKQVTEIESAGRTL